MGNKWKVDEQGRLVKGNIDQAEVTGDVGGGTTVHDHVSNFGIHGGGAAIPRYSQDTEPDIPTNTEAWWWDTANNKMWLIVDKDGTQYKVELS